MFGKLLYYDKETIDEFNTMIDGKNSVNIGNKEISKKKSLGLNASPISISGDLTETYSAFTSESMLLECRNFENKLLNRDDFYDLTESETYDISTIERGNIVKFDAFIEIPEEFDLYQLIDRFKPFLMNSIDTGVYDEGREFIGDVLGSANVKSIPLILDVENYLLSSKINQEKLLVEYQDMEEYAEEEVTVLARIASGTVQSNKAYYDPLKDFLILNRAMRKSFGDRGEELRELYLDREYRRIDILAIYR